jgi:hypothetical protein
MPAYLPGSSAAQNAANPSLGQAVLFDALSGPKGSPLDKGKGTGAMCTAIGYGLNAGGPFINIASSDVPATAPQSIKRAGFNDDGGEGTGFNSTRIYIGGGRMVASAVTPGVPFTPNPYTAGFTPCGAGNGGSRDGGAGPAFTGFVHKMVTAVGAVANGAVVETGFVNRSGATLAANQSVFGSAAAAQAAAS